MPPLIEQRIGKVAAPHPSSGFSNTSFIALASAPDSDKKLQFIEQRVKSWVSEVIEGQDGISVQANIVSQKVDGLIEQLEEKD